jgi:predicted anti-sigma-YlaC factor YlaD
MLGSLSEYIDGDWSPEPELCHEIEKHLEGCEDCRVVLNIPCGRSISSTRRLKIQTCRKLFACAFLSVWTSMIT